jgi:peptidoglycan/xylan/chitin deacetylase (PgdA/CDA1 family)
MLPILQEFDCKCLFFVTGASVSHTATMLWYEELYLMLLEGPEDLTLELLEVGLQTNTNREEKRFLWWELVTKLSRFSPDRRTDLLRRIRMQLGLSERWDAQYREDPACNRRFLVLDQAELQQLASAGMCIGAHTVSHPVLSQASADLVWTEISDSKSTIEQALGQEVRALAYPFGDSHSVTPREVEMAERAGFRCAFLNEDGVFGTQTPKFALPRMHVTSEMTLAEFEAHLSGFHRSLRELLRPASLSVAVGSNA